MIIECGKINIDTTLTHVEHKKAIESVTTFFCDSHDPVYWFTQNVGNYTRFFHLRYNKNGTKLKKIDSWERIPDNERKMKKVKVYEGTEGCYFTKNDKTQKFHYEEERDYKDISRDQQTHWKRSFWGGND